MKNKEITIPKGWRQFSFEGVADLCKGLTYKSSNYSNEQDGLVFLTLKSILRGGGFNGNGIKYYSGKYDKSAIVRGGDLIIANTDITRDAEVVGAPVLVPSLSEKPILISMDLSVINIDETKIDKLFFYYLLQGTKARKFMKNNASGSTVLHLKTSSIPKFKFIAPSLSEQNKIAEILSCVDEDIEKADEIIRNTQKLKKGLMQDLLTKGIGHTKFKKTELGEIPEEWEVKKLIDVATLQRGFDLPAKDRTKGKYPLASSNGITDSHDKYKVKGPGVFTGRSGTIGNVFYVQDDFWPLNTTLYIKDFHNNDRKFIYYLLQQIQIKDFYSGTGVPTLNRNIVHEKKISIPKSLEEQKRIAEILSAVDDKINIYKQIKLKLTELKKGLMQDLLSGEIRVKI